MELIYSIGDGKIVVKGFDDRIEVYKSIDNGEKLQRIEVVACHGTETNVKEIFADYIKEGEGNVKSNND